MKFRGSYSIYGLAIQYYEIVYMHENVSLNNFKLECFMSLNFWSTMFYF